jgi:hypothetical protein
MSEDEPTLAEEEVHRPPEDEVEQAVNREDVPEADAIEQAQELRATPVGEPEELGDVPEADALDQARGLGGGDDREERP